MLAVEPGDIDVIDLAHTQGKFLADPTGRNVDHFLEPNNAVKIVQSAPFPGIGQRHCTPVRAGLFGIGPQRFAMTHPGIGILVVGLPVNHILGILGVECLTVTVGGENGLCITLVFNDLSECLSAGPCLGGRAAP